MISPILESRIKEVKEDIIKQIKNKTNIIVKKNFYGEKCLFLIQQRLLRNYYNVSMNILNVVIYELKKENLIKCYTKAGCLIVGGE